MGANADVNFEAYESRGEGVGRAHCHGRAAHALGAALAAHALGAALAARVAGAALAAWGAAHALGAALAVRARYGGDGGEEWKCGEELHRFEWLGWLQLVRRGRASAEENG